MNILLFPRSRLKVAVMLTAFMALFGGNSFPVDQVRAEDPQAESAVAGQATEDVAEAPSEQKGVRPAAAADEADTTNESDPDPEDDAAVSVIDALEQKAKEPPERETLPDWVTQPPRPQGDRTQLLVHSDYHATERDCWKALDDELRSATVEYIADYLQDDRAPLLLQYSLDEIKSRLVMPGHLHHEVREFSFGLMHQTHALLEFSPEFRRELDQRWREIQHATRVLTVGGSTVGVLVLMALMLGGLRWSQRTERKLSTPLQVAALAAILAFVLVGVWSMGPPAVWLQWLWSQNRW
jgi:hypothetical protein